MDRRFPDGGPAFPGGWDSDGGNGLAGMSARDYFAAHAPPVPDWFDHEPPPENIPPLPDPAEYFSADETVELESPMGGVSTVYARALAADWLKDPCWDLPSGQNWNRFIAAGTVRTVAKRLWKQRNKFDRQTQWAWKYADMMIAAGWK